MNLNSKLVFVLLFYSLFIVPTFAGNKAVKQKELTPEFDFFRTTLSKPNKDIDLTHALLKIEQIQKPTININEVKAKIKIIAERIKKVPGYSDSTEGKIRAISQYLYVAGEWNNNAEYSYDLDDPLGTEKPENSLVSNYIETKKGNCVSMPLLVLLLSEHLDLKMNLSIAPKHMFLRFSLDGTIYNFEATSGGLKYDESYIKEFEISPKAITNKLYLQSLNNKKALISRLVDLASDFSDRSSENADFNKAFELTSLILQHQPDNVGAMIVRGNTWQRILTRDLKRFEEKKVKMTPAIKKHFDELLSRNLMWFKKAEFLGWIEPSSEYDTKYLKMIDSVREKNE